MKKSFKIIILMILIVSSGIFSLEMGFVKGLVLMLVSFLGVFILEARSLKRMTDYFEPLLFRCGRHDYVEKGLILLEKELLFKNYFQKKFLYLNVGIMNVRGNYNQGLKIIEKSYPNISKCHDKMIKIEWQYAKLKQGQVVLIKDGGKSYREKLCYCLYLINTKDLPKAIECLHELRGEETGNVIFREVNLLLSQLYQEIDTGEAQYYQLIADSFYNNLEL